MAYNLKPCPFCGGEAKTRMRILGVARIWCQCEKCGVRTKGFGLDLNREESMIGEIKECEVKAEAEWNKRAGDTA